MTDHLRTTVVAGAHPHLAEALAASHGTPDATDTFDDVIGLIIDALINGRR